MNNDLNVFSKDNLVSLIDGLIAKFFMHIESKDKQNTLKVLQKIATLDVFKSREATLKQKVFVVLTEHIINSEEMTYGKLAKEINERYGLSIPEAGNSMGKVLGNVLGSISTISYTISHILVSVYVKNKSTNSPGRGLKNLKVILDKEIFDTKIEKVDLILEKAKVELSFKFLK